MGAQGARREDRRARPQAPGIRVTRAFSPRRSTITRHVFTGAARIQRLDHRLEAERHRHDVDPTEKTARARSETFAAAPPSTASCGKDSAKEAAQESPHGANVCSIRWRTDVAVLRFLFSPLATRPSRNRLACAKIREMPRPSRHCLPHSSPSQGGGALVGRIPSGPQNPPFVERVWGRFGAHDLRAT